MIRELIQDLENRIRSAEASERDHKSDPAVVRRELAGWVHTRIEGRFVCGSAASQAGGQMTRCQWCTLEHEGRCALVKAIEYFENGTIRRVEFVTVGDQLAPVRPLPSYTDPTQPGWKTPATWSMAELFRGRPND